MGETLFSPRSLARVCEAVDWEDELLTYKDGTTNQQQYMRALAILWERWMRGWSLPDFSAALQEIEGRNFLTGLVRVLNTFPERIQQLKGFYEGLWYGANPGWKGARFGWWLPTQPEQDAEQSALAALQVLFRQLRAILWDLEEENNE